MFNPAVVESVHNGVPQMAEGMRARSHTFRWIDFSSMEKGAIVMNDGQKIFFDSNTLPEHIYETMDNWHDITVERD